MVSKGRERNQNTLKTHCKRGHAFDEQNTYYGRPGPQGKKLARVCRKCHAAAERARKSRARS